MEEYIVLTSIGSPLSATLLNKVLIKSNVSLSLFLALLVVSVDVLAWVLVVVSPPKATGL